MDRDFFLNAGLQFMPLMPEMSLLPEHTTVTSMVSSPVSNSTISNDIVAVRELAGKLNGDFSVAVMAAPPPLNSSPPELNLPIMDHLLTENLPRIQNPMALNPNLQLLAADPGFAERAAKFSCFGSRSFNGRNVIESNVSPATATGKFPRVSSSPAMKIDRSPVGFEEHKNSDEINMKSSRLSASAANSNEESSVSEQIPSRELGFKNQKDSTSRKRKGGSTIRKEEEVIDDSKRSKKTEQENTKPPEPPKDYIHVRARRGQATDSHSLAERVRREKISERMKLLQNLVPNCNKVTGKALMLDEIINYVQSLQRQVEFLSMKLATVNPTLDFATNDIISQNASQETIAFYQQNHQEHFNESAPMTQSAHEFAEPFSHHRGFGQDDLQSIVRMGFGENSDFDTSFFHTTMDLPSNMKTEL